MSKMKNGLIGYLGTGYYKIAIIVSDKVEEDETIAYIHKNDKDSN